MREKVLDSEGLFLADFNLVSDVFLSAAPAPNGAPVLDPLISSNIQTGAPSGTAVDDILSVASLYAAADPLFKGLAIVAGDDPRGTWEFSTDDGGHWAPLGPTSNQLTGPDVLKRRGLPARASRALGRAGGDVLAPQRKFQPGRMPPL